MNLKKPQTISTIEFITTMVLYGTIGIFVRFIPMSSGVIAFARGFIGMIFLLLVGLVKRSGFSLKRLKGSLGLVCLSGLTLGIGWIMLFEAYRYTTVATATLCYYFAPMFVIIASPFIFKEKFSLKKLTCVLVAIIGMVFVSGVLKNGTILPTEFIGILLSVGSAVLYAVGMILNKKMAGVSVSDRTIVQLFVSNISVLPYVLLTEDITALKFTTVGTILLIILGVVHTGIAYSLYFSSMKNLKAQTMAIYSYIDPVVAILLSAFILNERLDWMGVVGAVLILGAALVSELPKKEKATL